MNQQQLFDIWAPPGGRWTPWAKPVLFAHIPPHILLRDNPQVPQVDVSWAPRPGDGVGIIADLAGAEAVALALSLAQRGYRPVPLYNTSPNQMPVVPLEGLMEYLVSAALVLPKLNISEDAPPVFLLDSNRMEGKPEPGRYDNRWMVFEQDFPSATFLQAQGIRQALLVSDRRPGDDLVRILCAWRKVGMQLLHRPAGSAQAETMEVRSMFPWRMAALAAIISAGLRYNSAGGFGARVPLPSEGGGYS